MKDINSIFMNPKVVRAIHQIVVRNEQMIDEASVLNSFYDDNLIEKLDNINNQIIQGRRGTGKTHLLRVLACTFSRPLEHAIYIDCKKFGDTGILDAEGDSIGQKATEFFQHFVKYISDDLSKYFSEERFEYINNQTQKVVKNNLEDLLKNCTNHKQIDKEITQEVEDSQLGSYQVEGSVGLVNLLFGGKNTSEKGNKIKRATKYKEKDVIIFPNISQNIDNITKLTNTRIYLLVDEWSSLPLSIQPFFAEFLKRCFMSCQYVTVKIAVTYRTKLSYRLNDKYIGLERSAEIPVAIDLDQQLLFDKKPRRVIRFMSKLLIKHVNMMAGEDILSLDNLSSGFEEKRGFIVLVRASEGNARDFINILERCISNISFLDEERKEKIKFNDIIEAAHDWFNEDKCVDVAEMQLQQFDKLFRYIVDQKRTRGAFIYERQLTNSSIIKLLDARFIHLVSRGHTIRYMPKGKAALIILDYGSYCDILKHGESLDLFNDDSWEKMCRHRESVTVAHNYWPYDGERSVVSCFVDIDDNEVFGESF